ncbi:MAG: hypothetical protein HY958_08435 [Bacteroidia bacterium]|nr:hypothetical protein [Bacteroidia bacterium]
MKKIIKVYDPKEAPEGAVFITSKVEVNGVVIYDVPDYTGMDLNNGKKIVYFYEIDKKDKNELLFKTNTN